MGSAPTARESSLSEAGLDMLYLQHYTVIMSGKSTPESRSARLEESQREYDRLRRELATVGYLWAGTVLRRFLPCGRQECRCRRDPAARHGPYYYWTRKVKGKTVSRLLTTAEGELYMAWVGNRQRLHKTIARMYVVSRGVARMLLAQNSRR